MAGSTARACLLPPCRVNVAGERTTMSTKKGGGTSAPVASKAGKDLSNPKTPKVDRAPIASALAQKKGKGK